jgi:hypothetical protein
LEEVNELAFIFRAQADPIWTVLASSLESICTALASFTALKVLGKEGMAGLVKEGRAWRHNSLSSVMAIVAWASSMLFYTQTNAR